MSIEFDLQTVVFVTALVVVVAGVTFIADTLVRRDEIAGRIWALAYLSGMLTVVSYLFWAANNDAWWAVAVGNAGYVATAGCMWIGARAYNNRPGFIWVFVVLITVATAVAVIIEGPTGGDWAGAGLMFIAIAAFAGGAGVESLRGSMGANPNARALAIVLLLQCAYYSVRTVLFFTGGPDTQLFQTGFGTVTTSFIVVTVTIVGAISMSVLRADRARLRGVRRARRPDEASGLVIGGLEALADGWMKRGSRHGRGIAVMAVRFDTLGAVATAFGRNAADEMCAAWTESVRAHVPPFAAVFEDVPGSLIVIAPIEPGTDARALADRIVDGLLDSHMADVGGIRPTATIGVALSDPGNPSEGGRALIMRAESTVQYAIALGESVAIATDSPADAAVG
ncbi:MULTISPECIES: hypothetical protein [unclassified Leifsonia]|uniref:hypothetical protein n=1 Tax=unclassified Leifsonia TaxID=2663824 RepID=UPI0006FE4BD0|nr:MULTISPECIES: hypothetical protein [unclassified Leifsonia]KQX05645.1 hypothetical protein ASC59_16345 [Leifsonia sp. Root1293]KRA09280.1 hypothetical protein ASD61_16340 [Leifsonia sp. Root60]